MARCACSIATLTSERDNAGQPQRLAVKGHCASTASLAINRVDKRVRKGAEPCAHRRERDEDSLLAFNHQYIGLQESLNGGGYL